MKTVQLAIGNTEYAQSVGNLLSRDGTHRVYIVDQPDLRLDGVVLIDGDGGGDLSMIDAEPDRFVIIAKKGSECLSRIWDAGVRHVLFDGDPPNTAQLAIIAAELRLPNTPMGKTRNSGNRDGQSITIPPSDSLSRSARFSCKRADGFRGL